MAFSVVRELKKETAKEEWLTGVTNAEGTRQIGHVLRKEQKRTRIIF